MNVKHLFVLYENACRQTANLLEKAVRNRTDPFLSCPFYKTGKCRSDYICRQLVRRIHKGSWFKNALEAKRWMVPGTACYARRVDTGGIVIVSDPMPFLGDWRKNQKEDLIFITKKDTFCGNCTKNRAVEEVGLCEKCLPLFSSPTEEIKAV